MIANEHQVVEVLEDGTIYAFDLNVCDKEAERLLKNLHRKEGKLFNFDYGAAVFSVFVYCIHILSQAGWSQRELITELLEHTDQYADDDDDDDFEE
jgi:hypothetical protein